MSPAVHARRGALAALVVGALVVGAVVAPRSVRADAPDRAPGARSEPAAGAESAERLAVPPPGFRPRRGSAPHGRPAPEPWAGPRVELGFMHYGFDDRAGAGASNAFTFAGWLPTGRLRLGGLGELGARQYALGPNDALARAQIMVGYQHLGGDLGPVVPYAVVVATVGVVVGKRFHTSFASSVYGMGLEAGVDLRLVRTLWTGIGVGYQRVTSDGLAYDLFTVRLSLGL